MESFEHSSYLWVRDAHNFQKLLLLDMMVLILALWEAEVGELPQIRGHFWLPDKILSQNQAQMNKQLLMKFDSFMRQEPTTKAFIF